MNEYRASFREAWPFYLILGYLGTVLIGVSLFERNPIGWPAFLGTGVLGLLILVRSRFRVAVSDLGLEVTGLFRTKRVQWGDIQRVALSHTEDYWAERRFGPFTYDFCTPNDKLRINFRRWYERHSSEPLHWMIEAEGRCIGNARLGRLDEENRHARYAIGLFDPTLLPRALPLPVFFRLG